MPIKTSYKHLNIFKKIMIIIPYCSSNENIPYDRYNIFIKGFY